MPGPPGYMDLLAGLWPWSEGAETTEPQRFRYTTAELYWTCQNPSEEQPSVRLTGHVGAGAVVQAVLQESVLPRLLGFGVGVPSGLRALRRPVLHGVAVEFEAFALRPHLAVLVAASVCG